MTIFVKFGSIFKVGKTTKNVLRNITHFSTLLFSTHTDMINIIMLEKKDILPRKRTLIEFNSWKLKVD